MAPKRASSKAAPSIEEAAKAALLAEKKGKALADTTHQEACEDDAISKRQRNDQPTPEGSLRTCSSGGQPQEPPPGFAPLEGEDATEDGEVIGVSAEEQLQLRALRIKNRNLQKQKEILEAKRQRVSVQAKVRQMICLPELKPCLHYFHSPVGSSCSGEQVPTFGAYRSCYEKTTRDGTQES